jgi:hypothetical protein
MSRARRLPGLGDWIVKCPDFTSPAFRSREDAERWLAGVEKLGACRNDHRIEEVR